MANVLLVTHWTGGDVMPFIKMGEIFRKHGHNVTVFTHCIYEEKAKSKHLNFVAIDNHTEYLEMVQDFPSITDPVHYLNGTIQFQRKHHGVERCLREYEKISQYCHRADTVLVFRHRSSVSALLVAEKLGIPVASVFLAPNYISHMDFHEQLFGSVMKDEINAVRQKIGLPGISSWTSWMCLPKRKIAVWPQWFESTGEMDLEGLVRVGFLVEETNPQDEFSEELGNFLESVQNPVLISGGTSKMINPMFYRVAVDACKSANKGAILVVPFDELVPANLPDNIKRFTSVPLKKLMSHVSAVIHHGGIGTASEAIACGIPQLILPHMADRPDNAHRLRNLGVARTFPELRWEPELLAQGLKEMEEPLFIETCKKLSRTLHNDNTAVALCNVVDGMTRCEEFIISQDVTGTSSDTTKAVARNDSGNVKNIIITTHWTDGDILPFIRIGETLKKRGHKVTLLTHCYYEKLAHDAGLEFTAWDTPEQYENLIRDMGRYTDTLAGFDEILDFRNKYESVNVRLNEFEKAKQHCTQKDTVILAKNRSSIAALLASEIFKCPIVLFFMNPYEIGSMMNFHSIYKEQLKDEANELRNRLGLPPIHCWLSWQSSPKIQLALWPEWFSGEMPQWPHPVKTVGFPLKTPKNDSKPAIPEEIAAILDEDPMPILISGGTSKQIRPDFYTIAIEACGILGKKTIVATRYKEFLPDRLPSNISWFRHVPLDDILPSMGAIIHHGGIGTISGATYAGAPQLAMAYHVDRPFNASRIKSLGIGEYLPPSHWDPERIAEELRKLLAPEYKQKCLRFAKELPGNDVLEEVCKTVEGINGDEQYAISHQDILNYNFSSDHHFYKQSPPVEKAEKSKLQSLSPEVREFLLKKKLQAKKE